MSTEFTDIQNRHLTVANSTLSTLKLFNHRRSDNGARIEIKVKVGNSVPRELFNKLLENLKHWTKTHSDQWIPGLGVEVEDFDDDASFLVFIRFCFRGNWQGATIGEAWTDAAQAVRVEMMGLGMGRADPQPTERFRSDGSKITSKLA